MLVGADRQPAQRRKAGFAAATCALLPAPGQQQRPLTERTVSSSSGAPRWIRFSRRRRPPDPARRAGRRHAPTVTARPGAPAQRVGAATSLAACTVSNGWPRCTRVANGSTSARPTRGRSRLPARRQPPPSSTTTRPRARSCREPPHGHRTVPAGGGAPGAPATRRRRGQHASPPRPATHALEGLGGADQDLWAALAIAGGLCQAAEHEHVRGQRQRERQQARAGALVAVSKSMASRTSSALPAWRPSTWFMSVSARAGRPRRPTAPRPRPAFRASSRRGARRRCRLG